MTEGTLNKIRTLARYPVTVVRDDRRNSTDMITLPRMAGVRATRGLESAHRQTVCIARASGGHGKVKWPSLILAPRHEKST